MQGGATGQTSVSNSIGGPFRTSLDVRFELDLTSVSNSIQRPFQTRLDVRFEHDLMMVKYKGTH